MAFLAFLVAHSGADFGHMGWGDGGWWMMVVWMPVLIIALAGLALWAIRSTSGSGGGSVATRGDPLDAARRILAERYARGELDSEEYRERLEHLG